ncbi:MAG: VapC toxin family PIN domain ribonuclease [Acidobacteria bacterium]|nr:MAG: VapC toxin family PIN domain ribonuclease [Acidobacteriota bacterium]
MIILDTNVLSAIMRPKPEKSVAAWLDKQSPISIWTTSITLLELRFGLEILPSGRKRSQLMQALEDVLAEEIGGRVAAFDAVAAQHAADLMASRYRRGRPTELRDTMIAGIALAHHATLATRNTPHFQDLALPVINPWLA